MSFCLRRPYARIAAAAWLLVSALVLASCSYLRVPAAQPAPQVVPPAVVAPAQGPLVPAPESTAPPTALPETPPPLSSAGKVTVALLLPLTGPSRQIGQAMLDAAQMALYDLAGEQLELLSRDTKGTADGAAAAAQDVVGQGAQLIIGPLLAAEVQAVKPIAQNAHVPVIAFSTEAQLAGNGTYLMGFLPSEEVARVTAYAHAQGHTRFAVLAPNTAYGQVVADAVKNAVAANGATLSKSEFYDPDLTSMATAVKRFAGEGVDYDALFLPEGGARLKVLVPQLPYFKIDPDQVKFLGTGLWDDPSLGTEPALDGGWYAAPAPEARAAFEDRFNSLYHHKPPRLATLGYDAMALAAVLARAPQGADFSDAAITNPNGFSGLDGIFRFRPDGLVQRGLAVLEVEHNGDTIIDPAPQSFENLSY
ncbi:MAG TPA: penicillin-binding protein activator [Stellaceae bacterium]|nr:penicillin-binding protein activator [Stellaceae bacterium]